VVVDILPPELYSDVACDTFELSGYAKPLLDCFQAAFKALFPAGVHQVGVLEVLLEVDVKLSFDEGQVESGAVVRVDLIGAMEKSE